MSDLDRRAFAALLPALLLAPAAHAQTGTMDHPTPGAPTPGPAGGAAHGPLPEIVSGVYTPGPRSGSGGREAHRYLAGMLKAGNLQLEIHETRQQPGTPHEAVGTHLHNELWLVTEGEVELVTNGVARLMKPGDVGICCAGDLHYVRNAGTTPCSYFVVTVGPPETK